MSEGNTIVMKRKSLIIILTIFKIGFSIAQNTIMVAPGEGTLEEAILSAQPNDILQLDGGGEYMLSSSATSFGKIEIPITIEVHPEATEKAVLKLGPDAPRTRKYYFFTVSDGADLTLRGLDIHGLLNDTVIAASMVVFDARPDPGQARIGNFRFEDCIFHDFKDYIIHGMKDDYSRGIIQDSTFINNVIVYNAKHFLQYKHVSLKHLEMTNSTVYNLNGMALKIGKIDYRCVPGITDPTITPTGFIDHCTLDSMGDIHGHIQVDDPYHILTVSNCIITNQHEYDQPPVYFTDPHADTVVIINNTCFWNCGPPNDEVGGTNWIGYVFKDTITFDPDYRYSYSGDYTLPAGSLLLTYGTDGKAVGDPRWVQNTAGFNRDWRNNASSCILIQNLPNPFKDYTNIRYRLERPDFVSIEIFNIQGQLISVLINEYQSEGAHSITWIADDLEDGIYFCKMQSGSFISVRKMIHLK
jgi:hypothetical protein